MSAVVAEFLAGRDAAADFARCRGYLESALALADTHSIDDVVAGIAHGRYHFWPGLRSAAVTEIHQFPRARYLNVFLAGGDLAEILEMEPLFCSWGRHLGCSKVTLMGRVGWERVLKSRGWRRTATVLSKELS